MAKLMNELNLTDYLCFSHFSQNKLLD